MGNLLTSDIIHLFIEILGSSSVVTNEEDVEQYVKECSSRKINLPIVVLKPADSDEVSKIMRICHEYNLPVAVRGGGSGVSQGSDVRKNNIIISLERLSKILDINKVDQTVTVQAGVVTEILQQEVAKFDLRFPQNISSSSSSFIGGNIAISSGSPKSLKYGPTKNYVLNLQVVLADGRILWTGRSVNKDAIGYNLTQLFVGSEGTLGIITTIVLRLVNTINEFLLMVPFTKIENLFNCVEEIFTHGMCPSSMEFLDKEGYNLVVGESNSKFKFSNDVEALLWIELEGVQHDDLSNDLDILESIIIKYTNQDVMVAQTREELKYLWSVRKEVGYAAIRHAPFKDVDVIVPRSKARLLYLRLKKIIKKYNLYCTIIGHIGDGNFHLNIFHNKGHKGEIFVSEYREAILEIFRATVNLGGSISGEHGTGQMEYEFLEIGLSAMQIEMMRSIKTAIDPKGLFYNPYVKDNAEQ